MSTEGVNLVSLVPTVNRDPSAINNTLGVLSNDSSMSASYSGSESGNIGTDFLHEMMLARIADQTKVIVDSNDPTAQTNAAMALNTASLQAYSALLTGTPDLAKAFDSQPKPVGASTINSSGLRETKAVQSFVDVSSAQQYISTHSTEIFGAGVNVNTLSDQEKAQKISDYVTKNATYTPDSSPNWATFNQFASGGLNGDCEDIANFTASLMRGAGLTSDQVQVGVDTGMPGHVSLILNLEGNNSKVLDISSQAENHSTVDISKLQNLSDKVANDPFEIIYSDKNVVKADRSHVFDNGVNDATAGFFGSLLGGIFGGSAASAVSEAIVPTTVAEAPAPAPAPAPTSTPSATTTATAAAATATAAISTTTSSVVVTATTLRAAANAAVAAGSATDATAASVRDSVVNTANCPQALIDAANTAASASGATVKDVLDAVIKASGLKSIVNSSGIVVAIGENYAETLDNWEAGHQVPTYHYDNSMSALGNANAGAANMITGLTNILTSMAIMISDNPGMMEDAGALFLVQQKIA